VTGTDGRIYVMGGVNDSEWLTSVEAYDPTTKAWADVTPLLTPRSGLAAVAAGDGQIYAIGGNSGTEVLPTVEVYNLTAKTWTPGPSMSTARESLAAAIGPDGGIYAIGGSTALSGPTDSVEVLFLFV
jgi:serine/threonine-protein kinase PknK